MFIRTCYAIAAANQGRFVQGSCCDAQCVLDMIVSLVRMHGQLLDILNMQMLKQYVTAMSYESRRRSPGILKIAASFALCATMTGCSVLPRPRVWRETGLAIGELAVFDRTMRDFMVSRKVSTRCSRKLSSPWRRGPNTIVSARCYNLALTVVAQTSPR